jgi:hypothetical protein
MELYHLIQRHGILKSFSVTNFYKDTPENRKKYKSVKVSDIPGAIIIQDEQELLSGPTQNKLDKVVKTILETFDKHKLSDQEVKIIIQNIIEITKGDIEDEPPDIF